MKLRTVFPFLILLLAIAAPFVSYPLMLISVLCSALMACGFNLLVGYSRNISFGHTAFIGTSAYLTGYLLASMKWPTELGIFAGVAGSLLLGYGFGLLAIRRQGFYFGMITLAQAELVYYFFSIVPSFGGEDGLQGVPRGKLFGVLDLSNDTTMYYVVLAVFVLSFLFIQRVVNSPFGHILKSIRENDARATSLGYDTGRFKLLVFVLSAGLVGLAGSLKTVSFGLATLNDLHWIGAADLLVMVLVGGIGTLWGPVLGAGIVVLLHHFLGENLPSLIYLIMGVLFIACVLAFRRGIVGEIAARWNTAGTDRSV